MENVTYTKSELKKIIAESSSEFKAKIGDGVESGNKTENGKAYQSAKERAKDFDGGGKEEYWKGKAEAKKEDYNATTLDYTLETADENAVKRAHAQAKGYSSEQEMNNGIEKAADFSDNEKIYNTIKDSGKEKHEKTAELKHTGLQANKMPMSTFEKPELYENKTQSKEGSDMRAMINNLNEKVNNIARKNSVAENKSVKTVFFKRTEFINEAYMLSRIPDEFKQEGIKFRMKDKVNNEYLLEWTKGAPTILEHSNKNGMDQSMKRMKELLEYKSNVSSTDKSARMNEGEDILTKNINRMRELM